MFRKTPSEERDTTLFQEMKKELSPHLESVDAKMKSFLDRHAKIIFCSMILLILASFILTFYVLKPEAPTQAHGFKKDLKALPDGMAGEFSALQDLTLRAAKMTELKAEIERIISQDSISKSDSIYLEKAIEQLQYFHKQAKEDEH
ncbi:hypothetical protein [Algoriphagus confluentis]|uniref:Uncharacterized protein n=1 Tax=Algoriphagus confluentis TaxID=1697556 RepID=A0ABQ6PJA9_9BACT|nr:hypothetical protein Aconfl_06920 [Algoriphagus confluentis]